MNFCIDCKYLLGKRNDIEVAAERWRCYHSSNIISQRHNLVTGIEITELRLHKIEVARAARNQPTNEDSCRDFEAYEAPSYNLAPILPAPVPYPTKKSTNKQANINIEDI